MSSTQTQQTTSSKNSDEGEVFEVFQQDQKDPYPHHGGNLRAPDGELAIHYAKEYYGRRQESTKLWIIPRASIWEVHQLGQLQPLHQAIEHAPINATVGTGVEWRMGGDPGGRPPMQSQARFSPPLTDDHQGPHPSATPPPSLLQKRDAHHSVFAIFVQKQAGKPLIWLQDIEAPSIQTAAATALQNSEEGYIRLWLCSRNAIIELTNPDLLQPPLDRSYRRLDGYNIREKLRAARQRVQAQGEKQS